MLTKPPLSFIGNKHVFRQEYIDILKEKYDETYTFVDLFGGSGILSYYTKKTFPNATVIYNDYDNYMKRLENAEHTFEILEEIRAYVDKYKIPKLKTMSARKQGCISILEKHLKEDEYVDLLTISAYILYSGFAFQKLEDFKKQTLYNRMPKQFKQLDVIPEYVDVLNSCVITSVDYKVLYEKYKNVDKVCFIIDPPYLSTNVQMYTGEWSQKEYFDVIFLLEEPHYFYFTNDKSGILSFIEFLDEHFGTQYLKDTKIVSKHKNQNQFLNYDDLMVFR